MERVYVIDTPTKVSAEVPVKGWVQSRRDHGGLIFIDLRDHSGLLQLVIKPEVQAAFTLAEQLRDEFVISAKGQVIEREEGLRNPNIETGSIELVVNELVILNRSEALPIQVNTDQNVSEELRLKYRYLDLRRPKMQQILKKRAEFNSFIRISYRFF